MRLLVTRPEPDASLMAQELRALGHEAVLQPLLEFRSLDFDAGPIKAAGALVITSGNAVRALQEKLEIQDIADIPLYCTGEETARRASAAGFRCLASTARTAEELAAKIMRAASKGSKLVHATGEHQAFDLAGTLARDGLFLCTLRVYDMIPRPAFEPHIADEFRTGRIAGIILMSPRTAEVFTGLCRAHRLVECIKTLRYFCLAETVAKKLEALQPACLYVAENPSRKALLGLIAAHDRMKQDG